MRILAILAAVALHVTLVVVLKRHLLPPPAGGETETPIDIVIDRTSVAVDASTPLVADEGLPPDPAMPAPAVDAPPLPAAPTEVIAPVEAPANAAALAVPVPPPAVLLSPVPAQTAPSRPASPIPVTADPPLAAALPSPAEALPRPSNLLAASEPAVVVLAPDLPSMSSSSEPEIVAPAAPMPDPPVTPRLSEGSPRIPDESVLAQAITPPAGPTADDEARAAKIREARTEAARQRAAAARAIADAKAKAAVLAKAEARREARAAAQASRSAEASPVPSSPSQGVGASNATDAAAYGREVIGRIAAMKRYPDAARERRAQGTALVSFSISSSGEASGLTITRSSGDPALDAEALASVRRGSPFPPPPIGVSRRFSAPLAFSFR